MVVATLDSHTSYICRGMDGQHFKMTEWEVGTTASPFRVYCRSTTVPYFDDDFGKPGERTARNEEGKTYYVPVDMTYKDWSKAFVKDSVSKQTKEQFKKFNDVLGDNSPTIEEFVKIKHNEDEWKTFKAYTSSIKLGELTPLANFDLYKSISKEMNDKLLGVTTSNGLTINGKSDHSVSRAIGSVEQRRNGVQVTDVLDALTSSDSEVFPTRISKVGKSQKFKNERVEVSVNPDTGNIIQVNPVHTRKKIEP